MEAVDQPDTSAGAWLFVYGTLRKGFRSHELLRRFHARFIGAGSVQGRLYDLGEYPGAEETERGTERAHGELYFLPRAGAALRVLDCFEGFDPAKPEPNQFERRETKVRLEGGRNVHAWIYWLPRGRARGRQLPSGNYAVRDA